MGINEPCIKDKVAVITGGASGIGRQIVPDGWAINTCGKPSVDGGQP